MVLSRLRWSCRRGMLELDVLLGNFLEEAYVTLSPEDQAIFVELLARNDQELFYWLTGQEKASNPILAIMVEKIRHHAKNRKPAASF
ncbi:MAG: succinate dehydrogenase assembly factor 2 [Gammaproteobacteria bacterium]